MGAGIEHLASCALASGGLGALGGETGGPGVGTREFDSAKKKVSEAFLGVLCCQPRLRVWKRLRLGVPSLGSDDDAGGRELHDHLFFWGPCPRQGWDWLSATGAAWTHASRSAWVLISRCMS